MRPLLAAVAALLAAALPPPFGAQTAPPQTPRHPSLVVVLVVDQMRADYALEYGHQWSGGLRRLVDRGAWFRQALYPYANTFTCAGHATVSTGALPATHGIVGNIWWERQTGTTVNCTQDPSARTVSYGGPVEGGHSPAKLLTSTLTDNMRVQMPERPRIVTMSLKERTAIMMAGHRGDAVAWFDPSAGSLVTSSAYTAAPVPFVERFVRAHPLPPKTGTSWTRTHGEGFYLFTDAAEGEAAPSFWSATFPHSLEPAGATRAQEFDAWERSPFSDEYLERLAEASITELRLGKGPGTDFLGISFSALDMVGHSFGPKSHEVQDLLVRLDRTLGALFAHLDRAVGPSRYVVALTADHGVAPIPEQLSSEGVDAGRISVDDLAKSAEQVLGPALEGRKAVASVLDGQIYLVADAREVLVRRAELRDRLRNSIETIPGVKAVLFTDERTEWQERDGTARAVARSCFPGRSGDIIVVQQPYWLFGHPGDRGTTHGSPYRYDQWVPLLFYGSGVKAGRYTQAASPADLAPTLAWLCGVTLPNPDGRALVEALQPPAK